MCVCGRWEFFFFFLQLYHPKYQIIFKNRFSFFITPFFSFRCHCQTFVVFLSGPLPPSFLTPSPRWYSILPSLLFLSSNKCCPRARYHQPPANNVFKNHQQESPQEGMLFAPGRRTARRGSAWRGRQQGVWQSVVWQSVVWQSVVWQSVVWHTVVWHTVV